MQRHVKFTNSDLAKRLLGNWEAEVQGFLKVFPKEYRRALQEDKDKQVCGLGGSGWGWGCGSGCGWGWG